MEEAGFEEIGVYITRRQNTIAQYIAMRPIMDLFEICVWRLGAWVYWRCCNQEGLDIKRENEREAAYLYGEEAQYGEGATQEDMPGQY